MNTGKQGVRIIAEICRAKGIRYAVFSPGSRSAPLVIAFSQIPEIECIVIPDERVAGYFALGIAQQTQNPVAVICTSGTAVLNLGPALAEAFYQHIPMLFLTADRPEGAEENGENQAIKQAFVFKDMTVGSYDINADVSDETDLKEWFWGVLGIINNTKYQVQGPVHINLRIKEPLYDFTDEPSIKYDIEPLSTIGEVQTTHKALEALNNQVLPSGKKLLVVGMRNADPKFAQILGLLAQRRDIVILTESLANTGLADRAIYNYDACIDFIEQGDVADFVPEVVITLGNQIISKKLRQFLKKNKPLYHWDIPPYPAPRKHEIFDMPANTCPVSETEILNYLLNTKEISSAYALNWYNANHTVTQLTRHYLNKTEFSDLKVFELLVKAFPEGAHVQYGNSTPIRYSNFFKHHASLRINSNRGTSGIDGCVSTAAGAAYATKQLTICIVGDVSFFYDSNALWNNYLAEGLRIVVINNGGGNIFRLLNGPTKVNDFEKFFETKHHLSAQHLAAMYDIPYYFCDHQERLEKILATFFNPHNGKPAILEIKTNGLLSAEVYKKYFELIKSNKPD